MIEKRKISWTVIDKLCTVPSFLLTFYNVFVAKTNMLLHCLILLTKAHKVAETLSLINASHLYQKSVSWLCMTSRY